MAFEDTLRSTLGALAMAFNPEVETKRRMMETDKRNLLVKQLQTAGESGAAPLEQVNSRLSQLGAQPVNLSEANQLRAQQLQEKAAADKKAQEYARRAQAINLLPDDQKPAAALALQTEFEPSKSVSAWAEKPPKQTNPNLGWEIKEGIDPATKEPTLFRMNKNTGEVQPVVGAKPKVKPPSASNSVGLSPEAIDKAADIYHTTGTIANVGLGGKADKEAIINRERAKYPDSTGTDMVVNTVTYKANSMGLNALTKDITAITPYKVMLDKNADIAIELAKKINKTNPTFANKTINWLGQNITGDADVAEYLAQVKILQTESARVLNNPRLVGQLTDTAQAEMQKIINGDLPLASTVRVIERIKSDGNNRVNSMLSAKQNLTKQIGSPTAPTGEVMSLDDYLKSKGH